MTQKAIVKQILGAKTAQVEVQRQSACGHDCASCGGCGAPTERILTQADNSIGAQVGETVTIEGDNKTVYRAAAVVYVIPLVLFFALYALTRALGYSDGAAAAGGAVGFVLGILGAIGYNKRFRKRGVPTYVIVKRG